MDFYGGSSSTTVSIVSANGFAGSVAAGAVTLTTSITGILKGNGTSISAAAAGTDYQAVIDNTTALTVNSLTLSGNISTSAWTTNGVRIKGSASTFTDTTSSGTVAAAYTNVWGGNTVAATNVTTFTDYFNTYIKAPVSGSNVTFTNAWSLGLEGRMQALGVNLVGGTVTTSTPFINGSQTWNASGVTFKGGIYANITKTAAAAGSAPICIESSGSTWFRVEFATIVGATDLPLLSATNNSYRGALALISSGILACRGTSPGVFLGIDQNDGVTGEVRVISGGRIGFSSGSSDPYQNAEDTYFTRGAAGIFAVGKSGSGQSLSYPKGASNLTVTGTTNNLALDASAFQRLTGASTPVLTGVAPPSGGAHADGNTRMIYNVGATSIQLNHNDASSSAANRLYMSTGANITLAQNQHVRITYDATDNGSGAAGWRCSAAS